MDFRARQSEGLRDRRDRFVRDPMGAPPIPNWNRVSSALPEFLDELREAVAQDAPRPS